MKQEEFSPFYYAVYRTLEALARVSEIECCLIQFCNRAYTRMMLMDICSSSNDVRIRSDRCRVVEWLCVQCSIYLMMFWIHTPAFGRFKHLFKYRLIFLILVLFTRFIDICTQLWLQVIWQAFLLDSELQRFNNSHSLTRSVLFTFCLRTASVEDGFMADCGGAPGVVQSIAFCCVWSAK